MTLQSARNLPFTLRILSLTNGHFVPKTITEYFSISSQDKSGSILPIEPIFLSTNITPKRSKFDTLSHSPFLGADTWPMYPALGRN